MTVRLSLWAPVLAYMALIFWLSSFADPPQPPGPLAILSDKWLHGMLYAGLCVLVVRALTGRLLGAVSVRVAAVAIVVSVLYGVTDELHQYFVPPRQSDVLDVVADSVGATLAALALHAVGRFRKGSMTRSEL